MLYTKRKRPVYKHKSVDSSKVNKIRKLRVEGWQPCHRLNHVGPFVRCFKREKEPK